MGFHQRQIALDSIRGVNWQGETMLDIGCSDGQLSLEIKKKTGAHELVGIDQDYYRIQNAKKISELDSSQNLSFLEANAENLSQFHDQYFDVVFSNMTFQLLENPSLALKEVYRVLRPGGQVVINFNEEVFPVWAQQRVIYNYLYGDKSEKVETKKPFNAKVFKKMAEEAGFNKLRVKSRKHTFYYSRVDDIVDFMDMAYFAKQTDLTEEQNQKINEELVRYLTSIKTRKGIPETWRIVFARLVK